MLRQRIQRRKIAACSNPAGLIYFAPMRIVRGAFLAVLSVLFAGCGSFSSRWNGNYGAYVGVKRDITELTHYQTEGEWVALADIPLSAVMDTLFLPYDLSRKDREASSQSVASSNQAPAEANWTPVNRIPTEPPAEGEVSKKPADYGRVGYR